MRHPNQSVARRSENKGWPCGPEYASSSKVGALSASKALEFAELAEASMATIEALLGLHPQSEPAEFDASTTTPVTILAEHLDEVLNRAPKGSAPGPSNTTYEHAITICRSGTDAFQAVLKFMNQIVSGKVPDIPELRASRLIALKKPAPGFGVRPIAIGEVWLRLAALCALVASPTTGKSMLPIQHGVGVPGGAQGVGHAIQAGVQAHADHVTAQIDFRNAFNTLSRKAMCQALLERAPGLLWLARYLYRLPSPLVVADAPPEAPDIQSCSGVKQGDPCGPLFFALTLQGPLESVQEAHSDVRVIAYADDTFLQGPATSVLAAFKDLVALSRDIGLEAQPLKCTAYSPNCANGKQVADALGIQHSTDGIMVAGTPVGSAEFVKQHADTVADKLTGKDVDGEHVPGIIDTLLDLDLSSQEQFLLLRKSLQHRMTHVPRGVPWEHCGTALQRVQERVFSAAEEIFNLEKDLEITTQAQLSLPFRCGGIGLLEHSEQTSNAAYLSGAALAEKSLKDGPEAFKPFSGPNLERLQVMFQAVHEWSANDNIEESLLSADTLNPDLVAKELPGLQHTARRRRDEQLYNNIVELNKVDSKDPLRPQHQARAQRNLARLHSITDDTASKFMDALPMWQFLEMSNGQFKSGVRYYLGLSPAPVDPGTLRCECGVSLSTPDHAQTCSKLSGARIGRHDIGENCWYRGMHRAGLAACKQPTNRHLESDQEKRVAPGTKGFGKRGDILGVSLDRMVEMDYTVVLCTGETARKTGAHTEAGKCAKAREKQKCNHHAKGGTTGYDFVPIVIETHGRLGEAAKAEIKYLADVASSGGRVDRGAFIRNFKTELSVAHVKGNALVFQACFGQLARITGKAYKPGAACPHAEIG